MDSFLFDSVIFSSSGFRPLSKYRTLVENTFYEELSTLTVYTLPRDYGMWLGPTNNLKANIYPGTHLDVDTGSQDWQQTLMN